MHATYQLGGGDAAFSSPDPLTVFTYRLTCRTAQTWGRAFAGVASRVPKGGLTWPIPNRLGMQRGNPVRLVLADGETLTIAARGVARVWENLWCFAPNMDAMVVAGVVMAMSRDLSTDLPMQLTAAQSALIRQAVARPEAA